MDKQNLMPQAAQPVNRISSGQLPAELAELSEEALQLEGNDFNSASVQSSYSKELIGLRCSYDGDDAVRYRPFLKSGSISTLMVAVKLRCIWN
jgi:bacteriocin leader peptide (microcyclamide/patellamide family)